jgi:hypothetical protein
MPNRPPNPGSAAKRLEKQRIHWLILDEYADAANERTEKLRSINCSIQKTEDLELILEATQNHLLLVDQLETTGIVANRNGVAWRGCGWPGEARYVEQLKEGREEGKSLIRRAGKELLMRKQMEKQRANQKPAP